MKLPQESSTSYRPHKPRRPLDWRLVALIAVIFLLLVVGGILLFLPQLNTLVVSIEPSCSIGFTGTTTSVTIKGWTADQECQAILSGQQGLLSTLMPKALIYQLKDPPQEPIVCEVQYSGQDLVIRDGSLLSIAGAAICTGLKNKTT